MIAAVTAVQAKTWTGNNIDQYADDLAELFEHLDLKESCSSYGTFI